jgi:hypothetical protein
VIDPEANRDAKILLAGRIAAEAELEGVPLSDIERKMLYYSETGWTLDDMAEVKEAFDRECDRKEFERKVVYLITCFLSRVRVHDKDEYNAWINAMQALRRDRYYIKPLVSRVKPAQDLVGIAITAAVILGVMLLAIMLANLR